MLEIYLMIFLCVFIALFIGFVAVTVYIGYVVIMHDLEKKKEKEDEQRTL